MEGYKRHHIYNIYIHPLKMEPSVLFILRHILQFIEYIQSVQNSRGEPDVKPDRRRRNFAMTRFMT